MIHQNKSYLNELQAEWFERLIYRKDGTEPTGEQFERADKLSRFNARHTLKKILQDRVKMLSLITDSAQAKTALKKAEDQLAEMEQHTKKFQASKDAKGRTTYKNSAQ